ncbi:MAG: M23 family metallopeptidase [Gemmatimonadota bacterium]|nr:M23 family metallopeptidase [Gemmatimonadota bacterium]
MPFVVPVINGGFKWQTGAARFITVALFLMVALIFHGCARQVSRPETGAPVAFDEADRWLIWPLPIVTTARFTSTFGSRRDPLTGRRKFHTGVDLDGEVGTPVHAAGRGRVTFGGRRSGYGLLVIIDHGRGLSTYYAHCHRLLVEPGHRVHRGQVVALMGKTGRVTGSHLHFETRKHGRPFDPVTLLPKLRKY